MDNVTRRRFPEEKREAPETVGQLVAKCAEHIVVGTATDDATAKTTRGNARTQAFRCLDRIEQLATDQRADLLAQLGESQRMASQVSWLPIVALVMTAAAFGFGVYVGRAIP